MLQEHQFSTPSLPQKYFPDGRQGKTEYGSNAYLFSEPLEPLPSPQPTTVYQVLEEMTGVLNHLEQPLHEIENLNGFVKMLNGLRNSGTIKAQKKSSSNNSSTENGSINLDRLKNINIKKRSPTEREPKAESEKRFKRTSDTEGTALATFDEDRLSKLNEYEETAKVKSQKEKLHRAELERRASKQMDVDEPTERDAVQASKKGNATAPETSSKQNETDWNKLAAEFKHKGDDWKKVAAIETDKSKKKDCLKEYLTNYLMSIKTYLQLLELYEDTNQDFHALFASAANMANVSAKDVLKAFSPDYQINHKLVDASELTKSTGLSISIRVTLSYLCGAFLMTKYSLHYLKQCYSLSKTLKQLSGSELQNSSLLQLPTDFGKKIEHSITKYNDAISQAKTFEKYAIKYKPNVLTDVEGLSALSVSQFRLYLEARITEMKDHRY